MRRNLREGMESEESAAITKACPSREENHWNENVRNQGLASTEHPVYTTPALTWDQPCQPNTITATANTKSSYKLWNMEVVSKYFGLLFYLQFTGRPMNCVWMKHSWVWIRQNPRKYPKYKSKSLFTPKRRKLHILYHNVQIRVLTSKAQTWRAVIWNRLFKQDMQWKNIKRQKKPPGKMDHNTFPFSSCLILKSIIPCKCTLDRPTRKLAFFMLH